MNHRNIQKYNDLEIKVTKKRNKFGEGNLIKILWKRECLIM